MTDEVDSPSGSLSYPDKRPSYAEQNASWTHPETGEVFYRRDYKRRIHPEWSGPCASDNLLAELADLEARPELLTPKDVTFIWYLRRSRVRSFNDGSRGVYLTDRQMNQLSAVVSRFVSKHAEKKFFARQAALAKAEALAKAAAEAAAKAEDWSPEDWRKN